MNRQFHNKQLSLMVTNKQGNVGKLFDWSKKKFNGHMFHIKLEEMSYKMSFKALSVKIQWSKSQELGGGGGVQCAPRADRVKKTGT